MNGSHRDIAIVGAGPAGQAAARPLLEAGWRVSVFDEQPRPGGNVARVRRDAPASALEQAGERLTLHMSTRVLGVAGDGSVDFYRGGGVRQQRFEGVILACGAYDLHTPLPGTPSPVVQGAGGLQALVKGEGAVPGGAVIIAGAGPFLYVAASGLRRAGARITAVVDRLSAGQYARLAVAGMGIPGNFVEFARDRATLLRHRVAVIAGASVQRIDDQTLVLAGGRRLAFDHLGLTDGFAAQSQLPRSAGCAVSWHTAGGYFVTNTDEWGRTTVPGILVCGEGQSVRGWRHARVTGELAASALLSDHGQAPDPARGRRLLRQRERYKQFGEALEHALASAAELPDPRAVICPCEAVPVEKVEEAVALGLHDLSSIKVVTRCGMGPCQGRYCEPHVGRCIERGGYRPRSALNQRGLVRPVAAGELARGG